MANLTRGQPHAHRLSTYSLSNDQYTPEWLNDPTLSFDDVMRPPSYLFASLQQALDDYAFDQVPPAYEYHNTGAGPSTPRSLIVSRQISQADDRESIWEEDEDGSEGAADADDEFERGANDSDSDDDAEELDEASALDLTDGESTMSEMPPSPRRATATGAELTGFPPQNHDAQDAVDYLGQEDPSHRLSSVSRSHTPSFHLLHLQHFVGAVSVPLTKIDVEPYADLASCLATLDDQLLHHPFDAYEDVCYEAAVRGDTSPPNPRPFSPSPPPLLSPKIMHKRPRTLSPQRPLQTSQHQATASMPGLSVVRPASDTSTIAPAAKALTLALNNENVDNMDLYRQQPPSFGSAGDEDDESEAEDAAEPHSPVPTSCIAHSPLVYDARAEEHRLPHHSARREMLIADGVRCMSPVSMSLLLGREDVSVPMQMPMQMQMNGSGQEGNKYMYRPGRMGASDPTTDVACLFLHTPVPSRPGAGVQCFPTRPPTRDRTGNGSGGRVRGMLLRSLNFNRIAGQTSGR